MIRSILTHILKTKIRKKIKIDSAYVSEHYGSLTKIQYDHFWGGWGLHVVNWDGPISQSVHILFCIFFKLHIPFCIFFTLYTSHSVYFPLCTFLPLYISHSVNFLDNFSIFLNLYISYSVYFNSFSCNLVHMHIWTNF